jgi:hypothetical protein
MFIEAALERNTVFDVFAQIGTGASACPAEGLDESGQLTTLFYERTLSDGGAGVEMCPGACAFTQAFPASATSLLECVE